MLSVILYGRNDDHGYNYPKRLAISINCIAHMLSHPNDEIIFSDYNSPIDFPTILEAIEDTLTEQAKALLKIVRIRPEIHQRYKHLTKIHVVEPIARNAAVQRSSQKNHWILSTNSDMIFMPANPLDSLSSIVTQLEDGFYSLPRFEIPEQLWEICFDRKEPEKTISFLRSNYRKLHLNTTVRMPEFLRFDNPGDFQLLPRKALFEMGGFDEQMLLGWNVDANLCRRAASFFGTNHSLEGKILGFHCNHTKKKSLLHDVFWKKNSWKKFVSRKNLPPVLNQKNWGLADEPLECFSLNLNRSQSHLSLPEEILKQEPLASYDFLLNDASYNTFCYPAPRIFLFLIDQLANLPKNSTVIYFGCNTKTQRMLSDYFSLKKEKISLLINPDEIPKTSIFIFDFGFDHINPNLPQLKKLVSKFIIALKISPNGQKFIGINTHHTDFKTIFEKDLSTSISSFATGITIGFVNRTKKRFSTRRILYFFHYLSIRWFFKCSKNIRAKVKRLISS